MIRVTLYGKGNDPTGHDPRGSVCINLIADDGTMQSASVGLSDFITWGDVFKIEEGPRRIAAAMAWAAYSVASREGPQW